MRQGSSGSFDRWLVSGEAKAFLADHEVLVNGEPETRRGRQLRPGDVVRVADEELRVIAAS